MLGLHTTPGSRPMMRGDLAIQLRQVLRPEGTVGLVAAMAGGTALASSYLPWYEVSATVELLGEQSTRTMSGLPGWQAHPWGWIVPSVAIAMVVTGLLLAIDRPLPSTPELLLWGGLALALAVAVAGRWFPPVSRFDVAGTHLRDMIDLAGRLPSDVELAFRVQPGPGLWLALASAALLLATGLSARAVR